MEWKSLMIACLFIKQHQLLTSYKINLFLSLSEVVTQITRGVQIDYTMDNNNICSTEYTSY